MRLRGTSRKNFQDLADRRLREARILLDAGEFDGAYYLAGYAVDFALKAIIAKGIPAETLVRPSDVQKIFQHDLSALLEHAELRDELRKATSLLPSWTTVTAWSEHVRYEDGKNKSDAIQMLESIESPKVGILPWLKHRW